MILLAPMRVHAGSTTGVRKRRPPMRHGDRQRDLPRLSSCIHSVDYAVKAIRDMMGRVPVFGICLGHQLCGLALGGRTYKLKFGHHGGNHPVLNLEHKQVEITAQNHGFAVDPESLNLNDVNITHINLNDNTVDGIEHRSVPAFSVQYHPEASPGPHDSYYLFKNFFELMRNA